MAIKTVAIVGVGLIGGSFSRALKKFGFKGSILGVSRPQTTEKALACGAIDAAASLEQAMAQADLVYLAQPILRILDQLPEIARLARPGQLISDAGSTKAAIVDKAAQHIPADSIFLGGHPMAGKEGRGVEIAEAELFRGAVYVLTPSAEIRDHPTVAEFRAWIERIGSRPLELSPDEHDRIVSLTSHVPQLASTALAAAVLEELGDRSRLEVAGGGLRDMSRLAGSSYEIWEGILKTNSASIRAGLDRLISELEGVRNDLTDDRLAERFAAAQTLHKHLRNL